MIKRIAVFALVVTALASATPASERCACGDDWVELLIGGSEEERALAARVIGWIGADACEAAPLLAAGLDVETETVRQALEQALSRLGEHAAAAAPILHTLVLQHGAGGNHYLLKLGMLGQTALPALLELFDVCPAEELRCPQVRARILGQIGRAGPGDPRVLALGERMSHDPDAQLRVAALKMLTAVDDDDTAVVRRLLAALGDTNEEVRRHAVGLLPEAVRGSDEQAVARTVTYVAYMLDDLDHTVRRAAVSALQGLGAAARPALPALAAMRVEDDERLPGSRDSAVAVIASGREWLSFESLNACDFGLPKPAPPAMLVAAIDDECDSVRRAAILALTSYDYDDLTGELMAKLNDPGRDVRLAAATVLGGRVTGSEHLPAAVAALDDDDLEIRRQVVRMLRGRDQAVVATLIDTFDDPEPRVRMAVLYSLETAAPEQLPEIAAIALEDPDPEVRRRALDLARRCRPPLLEAIFARLDDPDRGVMKAAFNHLTECDLRTPEVIDHLLEVARSESPAQREGAITVLKHHIDHWQPMERLAEVIATLEEALEDDDAIVRRVARGALDYHQRRRARRAKRR